MCVLYPPWVPSSITKFNFQMNQRRLSFNELCYSFLLIDALCLEELMICVGLLVSSGFPVDVSQLIYLLERKRIYREGEIDKNIWIFLCCHTFF